MEVILRPLANPNPRGMTDRRDREHDHHHFAPGERSGKLPRIDNVIARLSPRMIVLAVMRAMLMMIVVVRVVMRIAESISATRLENVDRGICLASAPDAPYLTR